MVLTGSRAISYKNLCFCTWSGVCASCCDGLQLWVIQYSKHQIFSSGAIVYRYLTGTHWILTNWHTELTDLEYDRDNYEQDCFATPPPVLRSVYTLRFLALVRYYVNNLQNGWWPFFSELFWWQKQGSHSDWKTWKNGKVISSQGILNRLKKSGNFRQMLFIIFSDI